ncbi:MAG: hypothetical protein KC449_26815, partial [Anaerolineales bacterium]|nr:hypothetical protein [Anaerolineales bacterium]
WLTFSTSFPVAEAHLCNLLEESLETVAVNGSEIKLYVKPFQIVTLRLIPQLDVDKRRSEEIESASSA